MIGAPNSVIRDGLGWGAALWLFGYLLGFLFFPFVPIGVIGWYITPIGLLATAFILWKFVTIADPARALVIGLVWCALAVVLDYVFIVLLLNPSDGYYKFDVYLYYASALVLPVAAAFLRSR